MSNNLPEVSVWSKISGSTWGLRGSISNYDHLSFEPRFNEAGTWEIAMPNDETASALDPARLYTIDWRGTRTTWALDTYNPAGDEQGQETITVGGPGALSVLGREVAWPDPSFALGSQPDPPLLYTGNAETVIRNLISQNFSARRSGELALGTNANQGLASLRARARFDNLLELVAKKAKRGGIGVDVGLVNTSSTRATLTLRVYTPVDRSTRVYLSQSVGTIGSWSSTNEAPEVTKAIVAGAEGIIQQVTTTEGDAEAAVWGGHRVKYIAGPTSYDADDLTQAGTEAIEDGAGTTNVSLNGIDAEGQMAFTHYNVGDKVTGQLVTGLNVVDVISSIKVEVGDSFPEIVSTFGDPSADDPVLSMAQLVRALTRRLSLVEQKG